jgi:hypothetical protein
VPLRRSIGWLGVAALASILFVAAAVVTVAESRPAGASTVAFKVSGMDNIWGAGLTTAPDPGGDGGGIVPYHASVPRGTASVSFAKVKGTVSYGVGTNGPDGAAADFDTNISPTGGISGLVDTGSYFYLVGVFLAKGQPAVAPATLNFTNDHSFKSLAPQLGQVFFVGDGRTGTGTGKVQRFVLPSGAKNLYLGFADAPDATGPCGAYSDNSGSLKGRVSFTS